MARDPIRRQLSRQLDNIRKRYNRNAARYERQAETASPAMADALRSAARKEREMANTYRSEAKDPINKLKSMVEQGLEQSKSHMFSNMRTSEKQRNILADIRLKGSAGSKFYASTQAVWRGRDYTDRDATILDYFNSNFSKISDDVRGKFYEQFGRELHEPMDLLDVQNLIELTTGMSLNESKADPREEYEEFKRHGMLMVARMQV